ncbi:MAG: putative Chemotaxis protein CheA modulated with response regulator receiver region (Modular protein) [Deferribacteraceae bacterium]|jgi:chemosensory pili system protein ChpA (sensor histidine kinase/response regulator)|nr:putative Chemotaxis protein CheA modulated with response regulator receiver region (Modular protein) [Deferribacteraceae bacterium]
MAKINKQELIEFFLMESEEHFETILNGLLVLEQNPENWSIIDEMFRSTHTIKGSAAMVGFINVSSVAHKLEDFLDEFRTGKRKIDQGITTTLVEIFEKFNNEVKSKKDDLGQSLYEELLAKIDNISKIAPLSVNENLSESPTVKKQTKIKPSRTEILERADENFTQIGEQTFDSYIRVKLNKIDGLLNLAGELITNKNRQNERVKAIQDLSSNLEYTKNRLVQIIREFEDKYSYTLSSENELAKSYSEELLDGFSEGEFDRYDHFNILSRRLQEIGNDIVMSIDEIFKNFESFSEEISYVNRVTDSIQKGLTSIRLVPIDRLFSAATRAARSAAIAENKKVKVHIIGEKVELDKTLIDALTESFIHIVRNSISHGIENSDIRKQKEKDEEGNIYLKAKREGRYVILEVEDDGSGLNLELIREKVIQKGLLPEYEAKNMRADKLLNYIFLPGFSTKEGSSEISGRGVGLDVVKKQVESLDGNISVINKEGKGLCIQLSVPVTLLISEYLLLRENSQAFSIPIISVYESFNIDTSNVKKIGGRFFYKIRDEIHEIHDLGVLLKQVENAQFEDGSVGIIVEGIKKPYIITVDEIIGRETAVTKKLGRIVEGLKHITGATISPSGEVRLIIDPIRLIEEKTEGTLNYSKTTTDQPKSTGKTYIPNSVLIVDDSISIRKFLSSIISDMNLAVDEAYDGANALEKLEKRRYDLIITDLEMPVLNGYELIDKIRNYYRDNSTSIFVLTSRATEKHKNKAFELGANDFLIKPLNEDKIKEKIREVIFERA